MNTAPVNARAVNAPEPVPHPAAAVSPPSSVVPVPVPVPAPGPVPVPSPFDAFRNGTAGVLSFTPAVAVPGAVRSVVYRTAVLVGSSHASRANGKTTQIVVFEVVS